MSWSHPLSLAELSRGAVDVRLEPDEAQRTVLAKSLGLVSMPSMSIQLTLRPWLDGAEITGRLSGVVEQVCGISLDRFEQPLEAEFDLRVVPAGSPNTPSESGAGEIELELDAPDPPDVLEGDVVDLAAVAAEQLSLAVDPFPRKPGATFEYVPDKPEESPFAVLRKLKGEGE